MLRIYTDGACSGNPGPGGYGVVGLMQIYDDILFVFFDNKKCENTTNNREELKAIISAIDMVQTLPFTYNIYSDSAYCVNIIKDWMWSWVKSNWRNSKNEEVKNLDLVKNLYYLYDNKKTSICQIHKVKGHLGLDVKGNIDAIGNELADAFATNNLKKITNIIDRHKIICISKVKNDLKLLLESND